MSLQFKVRAEERSAGGDFFHAVEFRTGSEGWSPFRPCGWNEPALEASPKLRNTVRELYVRITLEDLRLIDGDAEKQADFIRRYLTPADGAPGLPVIRLLLTEGEEVSDTDLEYLSALFPPPGSITATTPMLFRFQVSEKGRISRIVPVPPEEYLAFVTRFLAIAGPSYSHDVQICVPPNFTHRSTRALAELYKDHGGGMAVVDAFGTTTRARYPQVRALLGIGERGGYSLRQRFGEKYAIYAFDTKPFTAQAPKAAASQLLQLIGGYSSFGPLRTPRTVIAKRPDQPPPRAKPPRVFVPDEICFTHSSVKGATDDIRAWAKEKGIKASAPERDREMRRRHSFERTVEIAEAMTKWVASGRLSAELDRRSALEKELQRVRRTNRRELLATQTTLPRA